MMSALVHPSVQLVTDLELFESVSQIAEKIE